MNDMLTVLVLSSLVHLLQHDQLVLVLAGDAGQLVMYL